MKRSIMQRTIQIAALLLAVVLATACSKRVDEPETGAPGSYNNIPASAGSLRLIHLSRYGESDMTSLQGGSDFDLSINDRKLTLFINRQNLITGATPWFANGRFTYGNRFSIPDSLFDAKGNAMLKLVRTYYKTQFPQDYNIPGGLYLDSPVVKATQLFHNNIDHPQDMIVYDIFQAIGNDPNKRSGSKMATLTIDRSQMPSAKPDYFKIRLINVAGKNISNPLDKLTLTYANGSDVSEKTTNVPFQQASDYIELPYGTYQFKVKDQSGKILPESSKDPYYPLDTSGNLYGFALPFNLLHTYSPGGVYTIIACWPVMPDDPVTTGPRVLPGYTVVTDVAPASAPNFVRIQGIHALSGLSDVHFAVDGQPLGNTLQWGQSTPYSAFSIGPHKLQLLNGEGKELASHLLANTAPLDNISVWGYIVNGQPRLLVSYNDVSNYNYMLGGINGTVYTKSPVYAWNCRFLNLSEIVPYASLVDNAGATYYRNYERWQHVGIGVIPDMFYYNLSYMPATVMPAYGASLDVYNAPPGQSPGTPLQVGIKRPMVANQQLYPAGKVPAAEPGVYTIALIGNGKAGSPLQLISIKHNQ